MLEMRGTGSKRRANRKGTKRDDIQPQPPPHLPASSQLQKCSREGGVPRSYSQSQHLVLFDHAAPTFPDNSEGKGRGGNIGDMIVALSRGARGNFIQIEQSPCSRVVEIWEDGLKPLLGPTGSGKSSFVEAVASNPSLGLSSDKLEGFTQSVSIYRIINVYTEVSQLLPIYLVDVPGNLIYFCILYHTPINNPRLPGSQRQVLRTFEALTGRQSAGNITVISTMWDLIWNDNTRRRAEGNFSQLRNEIWKDYIARGAEIVKFHNTQDQFSIQESVHLPLQETPFASHIYTDLQTRISNLQTQQANIQSELQMATVEQLDKLEAILIVQLKEVQRLITKFEDELYTLGTPAAQSSRLAGSFPRATKRAKGWGKLSKHRASD
ncbi:hypothetical protein BJ165DRAFT_1596335 [Panaeolus papilionaceus]|nr:hypothetical protein BJ165DRAFT_1596335 [Panaeolus papilionaceus]